MGWTKRQLVEDAYAELALANYVFDLDAEEYEFALRKLDTMMASLSAQGLNMGYAFGMTPDESDLDQDSGLPLVAVETVYLKLAINICGSKGKTAPPSTKAQAAQAYMALTSWLATRQVREQQLPSTMPIGAGNKPFRATERIFNPAPDTAPLSIGDDGGLVFGD